MDRKQFRPSGAKFIDPYGSNREQVKELARRVLDAAVDHTAGAAQQPPFPPDTALPVQVQIPEAGVSDDQLVSDIRALLDASLNDATPNYIGHMDSLATVASALGDLVAALSNNNMLSVEMAPAFSRLEDAVMRDFAERFGLGPDSGGMMASGGSLSNLLCLATARNAKLGTAESGVHGLEKKPVLFASEAAHASIKKSAMILGLGTDAVISVALDADYRMDPDELRRQIEQARGDGLAPFCVVATAGNTTTGNIDPLDAIAAIVREHGLWYHVDAVWGGGLILSGALKGRLQGIEHADSVTFNPQKMLLVARTNSMALFRDYRGMQDVFRVRFPYMREGDGLTNLGEVGIQGSRPAEILKLWLSLQHIGREAYSELIESRLAWVDRLSAALRERDYIVLAAEPETGIVCFRGVPPWLPEDQWEQWSADLQASLLRDENIYISRLPFAGKWWLRIVLLNPYTGDEVAETLLSAIDTYAEASRPANISP